MKQRFLFAIIAIALIGPSAAQPTDPPGIIAGTKGLSPPSPPGSSTRLRLAILPDRTTGRDWGLSYLKRAVADFNRVQPDAVLSIGDMVQGYTRDIEEWKRQAAEYRSLIAPLNMPFYPLAGNHEVVSGTRNRNDLTFQSLYQSTFAPLYYAVEFDRATAIVLYSDDPTFKSESDGDNGIGETQRAWLFDVLQRAADRQNPILVLMHRPLWRSQSSRWNDEIHPRLVEKGVTAVIAGHYHSMQRDADVDGVQYHIVGTCGGMIDQAPLAGQLQHLTFVNIDEAGEVLIYHQPVGMTLPDDFVMHEDQKRVFQLKSSVDTVSFLDAVDDPVLGPVDSTVRIRLHNPIDQRVRFDSYLMTNPPEPTPWLGADWISRVEQDRFNPYTTDIQTRFHLERSIDSVTIEPGESVEITAHVLCNEIEAPRNPPEFHFVATFEDSYRRSVPVVIRCRLPMNRTVGAGAAVEWPLCAWDFSVYETLEPNPRVALSADESGLSIKIRVPDDRLSGFVTPGVNVFDRYVNPTSDAIRIRLTAGTTLIEYYVEPRVSSQVWRIDPLKKSAERTDLTCRTVWNEEVPHSGQVDVPREEAGFWTCDLRLDRRLLPGGEIEDCTINIGVADNDETYHSQWRWLSPSDRPARIRLE